MLFCVVIREETEVLISVGTSQCISQLILVANEEKTSWQYISCFVGMLYVVMTPDITRERAMISKYNVCEKTAWPKGSL